MPPAPFQIKICGITRGADAHAVAVSGADALGVNFYPASPRYVEPSKAREIAEIAGPAAVRIVGVFVNATVEEICEISRLVGLDIVQLHGDETPQFAASLRGLLPEMEIIKAVRCRDSAIEDCEKLLALFGESAEIAALLLDAHQPGQYGGTGQALDWSWFRQRVDEQSDEDLPLLLAGGLTAENVGKAIRLAKPAGVDTASGVESSPGIKDADKINAFVQVARRALAAVAQDGRE